MTVAAAVAPAYFDAALVAKFYVNEPGRDQIRQLARQTGAVLTSGIAVAEVSAAFYRKLREGALDRPVFKALQGQFAHDLDSDLWHLAGPPEALLRDVHDAFSRLQASVFLRALDALHLVTARAEGFTRIYSNDRHLLDAARHFGLVGVDPTR
jgi:predicted nucleic acid-binding protein